MSTYLDLNKKDFNKLKLYVPRKGVVCNEAKFYQNHNKDILYKIYNTKRDDILSIKEKQVSTIIDNKDKISIPELVIPQELIRINGAFRGITLDFIKGINSSVIIYGKEFPLSYKLKILKDLGNILKKVRELNPSLNICLGDIHPDNYIVGEDRLYVIDTDSMKINELGDRISYYLDNDLMLDIKKYPREDGIIIPSVETDLVSFILIIFGVVCGDSRFFYSLSLDAYKRYLNDLDKLGFDSNLLNAFASIYDSSSVIDPTPYLDEIKEDIVNSAILKYSRY